MPPMPFVHPRMWHGAGMKQHGDEHWHGHREITAAAVARLFREHAGPDGTIRGIREEEYFERLNDGQEYPDRVVAAGVVEDIAGTDLDVPFVGFGPTTHSAYLNGKAQREHFMADPRLTGEENMAVNTAYLYDELRSARAEGGADLTESSDKEMRHLGAAVHALQDSYSGAHAWRDDSVYDGDPTARVQSLHVFTPGHAIGLDDGRNTHVDEFDKPLAESGSARAATEATYRLLAVYEESYRSGPEQAEREFRRVLGPMIEPSPAGVVVNLDPEDRHWQAERDRRLEQELAPAGPNQLPAGERSLLAATLDQHGFDLHGPATGPAVSPSAAGPRAPAPRRDGRPGRPER